MIIDKIKIGSTTYNVGAKYENVSGTPTKLSDFNNDEGFIDKDVNDLTNYTPSSETTSQLELVLNSETFKLKGILKDSTGATIYTSNEIDLPIESVVVSGTYDSTTKEVVLTLVSGSTIRFSVADLVSGLISSTDLQTALANYYTKTQVDNFLLNKQDNITSTNKLASDLVDDTNSTNKFVTSAEKAIWNGKQDELTAGDNITIENGVISATGGSSSNQVIITSSTASWSLNTNDNKALLKAGIEKWLTTGEPLEVVVYVNSDKRYYYPDYNAGLQKVNGSFRYETFYTTTDVDYSYLKFGAHTSVYVRIDYTITDGVATVTYITVPNNKQWLVFDSSSRPLPINNTSAYTPTAQYHPATKGYVDSAIASAGGNYSAGVGLSLNNDTFSAEPTLANIAPTFSTSSTYNVGDYVIYDGVLYVCSTAVETAGNWNSSDWTQTTAMSAIGNINTVLASLTLIDGDEVQY